MILPPWPASLQYARTVDRPIPEGATRPSYADAAEACAGGDLGAYLFVQHLGGTGLLRRPLCKSPTLASFRQAHHALLLLHHLQEESLPNAGPCIAV